MIGCVTCGCGERWAAFGIGGVGVVFLLAEEFSPVVEPTAEAGLFVLKYSIHAGSTEEGSAR